MAINRSNEMIRKVSPALPISATTIPKYIKQQITFLDSCGWNTRKHSKGAIPATNMLENAKLPMRKLTFLLRSRRNLMMLPMTRELPVTDEITIKIENTSDTAWNVSSSQQPRSCSDVQFQYELFSSRSVVVHFVSELFRLCPDTVPFLAETVRSCSDVVTILYELFASYSNVLFLQRVIRSHSDLVKYLYELFISCSGVVQFGYELLRSYSDEAIFLYELLSSYSNVVPFLCEKAILILSRFAVLAFLVGHVSASPTSFVKHVALG